MSLDRFDKLLQECLAAAHAKKTKILEIMERLRSEQESIIAMMISKRIATTRDYCKKLIQDSCAPAYKEATDVISEMSPFVNALLTAQRPDGFLGGVYYGDAYDMEGFVAFQHLLAELKKPISYESVLASLG